MAPSLTATCAICASPCSVAQHACWYTRDDGTNSRVEFCCSEHCVERWDASHWSAGTAVHSGVRLGEVPRG